MLHISEGVLSRNTELHGVCSNAQLLVKWLCKIHLKSNCQMEKPDSQRSQAGTAGQAGTECTVLKAVETKFQEKHCWQQEVLITDRASIYKESGVITEPRIGRANHATSLWSSSWIPRGYLVGTSKTQSDNMDTSLGWARTRLLQLSMWCWCNTLDCTALTAVLYCYYHLPVKTCLVQRSSRPVAPS